MPNDRCIPVHLEQWKKFDELLHIRAADSVGTIAPDTTIQLLGGSSAKILFASEEVSITTRIPSTRLRTVLILRAYGAPPRTIR